LTDFVKCQVNNNKITTHFTINIYRTKKNYKTIFIFILYKKQNEIGGFRLGRHPFGSYLLRDLDNFGHIYVIVIFRHWVCYMQNFIVRNHGCEIGGGGVSYPRSFRKTSKHSLNVSDPTSNILHTTQTFDIPFNVRYRAFDAPLECLTSHSNIRHRAFDVSLELSAFTENLKS